MVMGAVGSDWSCSEEVERQRWEEKVEVEGREGAWRKEEGTRGQHAIS